LTILPLGGLGPIKAPYATRARAMSPARADGEPVDACLLPSTGSGSVRGVNSDECAEMARSTVTFARADGR
jgi:hypothetical protein